MNEQEYTVLDPDGIKRLRLLDPMGEPEIIECDGIEYKPRLMCDMVVSGEGLDDSYAHTCGECGFTYYRHTTDNYPFCMNCGAEVRPSRFGRISHA